VASDESEAQDVETEDGEEDGPEPLPRWLAPTAVALILGTIAAVFGWSTLWRPDPEAWGALKCEVEASRTWPDDHPQHRVLYARCIEQLP
jgi:hypothetical protein